MNTFKKTIIALFVSGLLVASSNLAYAEEAAAPVAPAVKSGAAEVVLHLEQSSSDAAKSDFSSAALHLKAARNSAAEIDGNALEVHKGVVEINNGLKQVREGKPEGATVEIAKAIKIFKAM